jgi:hypothetical protein
MFIQAYVKRIQAGLMTINDVPETLREQVLEALNG